MLPPSKTRRPINITPCTTTLCSQYLKTKTYSHRGATPCSFMAASSLPSSFRGSWASPFSGGEDRALLSKSVTSVRVARPSRPRPMMGNKNEGKGVVAPLVVITRDIVGKKRFNQLRGKAIALHSQVITEFCKSIGADGKQRQGLIRLAKKNGERLGFLA